MRNICIITLFIYVLTGCVSDWDRRLDEKQIDTELSGNTNYFSTKNVRVKITEYKEMLTISLDFKLTKNIKLPVDSFYGDTLTETRFFLKLFCDGKPVLIDSKVVGYLGFLYTAPDSNMVIIPFRKQNITSGYHDEVQFPLTVFHSLKTGKHHFEAELFNTAFYGSHFDTTSKVNVDLEAPYHNIYGKVKFIMDIPEIYLTTLYGEGLDLRNDDKFSPVGMDFSFRLGYPDIYWEIFYPASGEGDFTFPYWRSREATYSTNYLDKDTVYLYHFSPNDEFKIGVYDRDDLSGDDFLGDWFGPVKELVSDSIKTLHFDNLKWFRIKAKQQGCINKSSLKNNQ
ncbi:MAG: hypothetical protein PHX78_12325 [bacterium]|nr:hypothetical protein [bacterium]